MRDRAGSTPSANAFPPHVLREYALLADGERGALVGPRGDIGWMCAPRWHSDAVFSCLVGGPGVYAVTPEDPRFVWGGYYEEGSLIWHSRWVTSTGIVECREALAMPADADKVVMLRRIHAIDGMARVRVSLDARAGFGRESMEYVERRDGVWHVRTGPIRLRWVGASGARRLADGSLAVVIEIKPGDHHDLVLELADSTLPPDRVDPGMAWDATEAAWATTVPVLDSVLAPRDARHAYAVLAGLTSGTGGMVAAATLGLPERAESGRNYDYRYAWIRDQGYAGEALAAVGGGELMDRGVRFVAQRVVEDGPNLCPAYQVDGQRIPRERRLAHLSGYPGGEARAGNRVNKQFQLDALGEALLLLGAAGQLDRLDSVGRNAMEIAAAAVQERWGEPDAGIWELDDQHWAHSRLTCVAGLRAAAAAADPGQGAHWAQLADTILADVGSDCVHPTGRWQRSPDDQRVDTSLLLPALRGAVPPSDPRTLATLAAVENELASDGYAYRFRHDERPLEQAEGAFVLCGFLMALAANQQGRDREAIAWFERNRSACGPPGLFTEEFDVGERQLRGNFPQAFVHALLLESAARLAETAPELSGHKSQL